MASESVSSDVSVPSLFYTEPARYRHLSLKVENDLATLTLNIDPEGGFKPGYELKLNSYDLGVDIELSDAVNRLRFEHPEVTAVIIKSGNDRVFCAGANIPMLGSSTHAFKVNFCKYTNETRLSIEDASRHSSQTYICAVSGPCAGGGYELALACDRIVLVDDANSAVSLPEVPLLGVLPGTGGLTRLVDKRKVRRDLADVFCTTSEGVRGKRALEWRLVDAVAPKSKFEEALAAEVTSVRNAVKARAQKGIALSPVIAKFESDKKKRTYTYQYVTLTVDGATRQSELTVTGPTANPTTVEALHQEGAATWALQAFRELDDAILHLRFDEPEIAVVGLKTRGDISAMLDLEAKLDAWHQDWLVKEVRLLQARVLRRVDLTAKSFFAFIDQGSVFVGPLFELALASDRIYMLDDRGVECVWTPSEGSLFPMSHGISRLDVRFAGDPDKRRALEGVARFDAAAALKAGLVTFAPDDIDWEDDVRIALEERASISPDALTGMEASLRFVGNDSGDSKIFSRLSAWQNWIFQRPNAVGPEGALTKYGHPERPVFNWTRC